LFCVDILQRLKEHRAPHDRSRADLLTVLMIWVVVLVGPPIYVFALGLLQSAPDPFDDFKRDAFAENSRPIRR
jgi:hypothetical protein